MPGKRKKDFKSIFRQDRCYKINGTTRHTNHGPSKMFPQNRTPSEPDYSNDDTSDSGSEFDQEFELSDPLENELLGNPKRDFTKLFGESISRFEESRHLYRSDKNSRRLQDDIIQSGLGFLNIDNFHEKEKKEKFYDEMIPEQDLEGVLQSNSQKYKRCRFYVENAHESVCQILDVPDTDGLEEIQISGRSKAGKVFDGDVVLVEIFNHERYLINCITKQEQTNTNIIGKPHKVYGKIVGIFDRDRARDTTHPVFICILDETSNFLMRPVCKSVPKLHIIHDYKKPNVILVHQYDAQSASLKVYREFIIDPSDIKHFTFQVVYIKWTDFYPYPLAAVIKVIKIEENPTSALENTRLQYHVPKFYLEETVKETERKLIDNDHDKLKTETDREDFCSLRVFTIDPSNSIDLDDALSIETGAKNYHVGVHIADVGAIIQKGDAVDIEAQKRACTFYPGQGLKPYHMLPEPFATSICSLLPGVSRPAITIFFTIDKDTFEVKTVEVKKTTVKSLKQFTYEEVQKIIEKGRPVGNLDEDILLLFCIARRLRFSRIRNAMFHLPVETKLGDSKPSVLKAIEAHYLVEEFMILANKSIAQYLTEKFPDVIPVRCQESPSQESINTWREQNNPILDLVLLLQDVDPLMDRQKIGLEHLQSVVGNSHFMPLQKWVWDDLLECIRKNEMQKATELICSDHLHPLQCLALEEWMSFQQTSFYKCSGMDKSKNCNHFSLKMKLYVHFTSPIRRYSDLIVNRLIHAVLENTICPYLPDEVHDICVELNSATRRANQFQKQCEVMFLGFELKNTPKILTGFVKDFTAKSVSIIIPGLKSLPLYCKEIPLNLLHLKEKPSLSNKKGLRGLLELRWLQRIYNISGKPVCTVDCLYTDKKMSFCKQINPHANAKFVMQETWKNILKLVIQNSCSERKMLLQTDMEKVIMEIADDDQNLIEACRNTVLDHSSEVETGNVIKQGCEYTMLFSRGQIVNVQVSSELQKGILSPSLQLFDMTCSIKHCLQHTRDPIKFLSKYSMLRARKVYASPEEYLTIWLPLHEMEAVTSAVDDDSISINNVHVCFDTKRTGYFYLTRRFCEQRDIDFSTMSKSFILEGEDNQHEFQNRSFICLKSEHALKIQNETMTSMAKKSHHKINWILHGQLTAVEKIKARTKSKRLEQDSKQRHSTKSQYKVQFKLHEASCDPTYSMLYGKNPSTCSVEIIPKSETDSRTEAILRCLAESTDLAKKIALSKGRFCRSNSWYTRIALETKVEIDLPNIIRNNQYQKKAMKKALTSPFTLIQGPPGTGKTFTGTKLVYLFNKINTTMQEQGYARLQLVFCGPNNKSVDLVAKWMIQKYGKSCPDIVRLYGSSLENKDFPTLGKYFSQKASGRDSKPDVKLKDVSVHRLIRLDGKPFSEEIKKYDDLFLKYKKGQYEPTLEDLKKYRRVTSDAVQDELKRHKVIFCTTSVATSPRVIKAVSGNIQQLIIDEAGMCTEPESIAAIIATKAKQVVLIGDHKQLRPVLKSTHAADMGLKKSLFERYSDRANMLQIQYRMHPGICEFPSKQFYDGKLQTDSSPKWDIDNPLGIWMNREKIPIVFCHVEGEEEYLAVSTEEGNEQSCSNKQEVDKVVEILKHLIQQEGLDLSDDENVNIISQYNAQCHQIRLAVSSITENVNINTVVASQGGEWNYVIFSTVRSLPRYRIEKRPTLGWCKKNLGFISDEHQINVALTRARRGLIIIGNKNLLSCDPVWKKLIDHYATLGCVVDESEDFPTRSSIRKSSRGLGNQRTKHGGTIGCRSMSKKLMRKKVEEESEEEFYRGTDREKEMLEHRQTANNEESLYF